MAIELVTGKAGTAHISSADVGRLIAGVCGLGRFVLQTGTKFAYTQSGANLVIIESGDAVVQGRHIIIPTNTTEEVAITNASSGMCKYSSICLQYSKDTSSTAGIESASIVVVDSAEVASGSTPPMPVLTQGDIIAGATVDQMPLYRILVTDTGIDTVIRVYKEISTIRDIGDGVAAMDALSTLSVRRVANSYCDATAISRLAAYKRSGMLFLNGNLGLSASMPTGTEDVTIATITGWNACSYVYQGIPARNGGGTLGLIVTSDGSVRIHNYSGAAVAGWARFSVCVPAAITS